MCDIHEWLTKPPIWRDKDVKLLVKNYTTPPKKFIHLDEIISKSENFPIQFKIDTIRCQTLLKTIPKEILERNIQSAYPIIHENILNLCTKFIRLKRKHGSKVEKNLYKDIGVQQFIQRLLDKRAVAFFCSSNNFVLRDGTDDFADWETIGTPKEKLPLILQDYLSYEEIKISAFLSVSSYTYFINEGARDNRGQPVESRENIQPEGIIIGLIGTQLVKRNVMEFQEVLVTSTQNTGSNGYGKSIASNMHSLFSNFYQENLYLYDNIRRDLVKVGKRFTELRNGDIFDNIVYAKRLAISFDTLLHEANHRAKEIEKFAYIHVVGIGLGVWKVSRYQDDVFVQTFGIRLKALGINIYNISDVNFSYFHGINNCLGVSNDQILPITGHPKGGIKIHISQRQPYTKLDDPEKILVVSYAWDGNALPGNEFWLGCLGNSSDSSTASSCQVSELHNPFINETVCANNLMVATCNGLIPIHDYINNIIQ